MKLLDKLTSIFSSSQKRELEKLLYRDIRDKKIIWRDVLTKAFEDRLVDLSQPYVIPRIVGNSKILPQKIIQKLEDVIVVLLSLVSESNLIGSLIGKHEMFRKDTVKSYTDVSTQFLNMIDNTIKDYRVNMIEVKNNIISIAPSVIQQYFPVTMSTEFFPENVIKVSGNEPTPVNIFPGTESGYWITSILSQVKCGAGAKVIMDFGGLVYFNNIVIKSAGKYILEIDTLEIMENDVWVPISSDDYEIFISEKTITLVVTGSALQTKTVRLTLIQPKYDFIWSKKIDNTETYLEGILYKDSESLLVEKNKLINDVVLDNEVPIIVKDEIYHNVYEYIMGCYNIAFYLKTYDGQNPGIFTSKKYVGNSAIRTVKIAADEYKPSGFTITYDIIQHDDSRIEDVDLDTAISLTTKFNKSEVFSNITGNVIILSSYPLLEEDISIKIDGDDFKIVNKFDQTNTHQCVIKKNMIFVNEDITGSVIDVRYKHYSDYVVIQVQMNTNTDSSSSDTPRLTSFDVKINEV